MTFRSVFRIGLLAGVALVAASPAMADVKAGVDAWSRGDYTRAVAEWKGPAERGDADAQFNLAQAYKLGRGVKPDLAKAEDLFGKAAARGHLQASDNFGLLLFQRGERSRALPYIRAGAERGDPRAQYLLGLAHFNGDNVEKDWVRAYALVSLAQQAGLPQAAPALAQMDNYVPIEQRQRSVVLASELAGQAQATRERQLAAVDLGGARPGPRAAPPRIAGFATPVASARTPAIVSAENAVAAAQRAAATDSPQTAGADYARPRTPQVVTPPRPGARPQVAATRPNPTVPPARVAATAPTASGAWRVQLGAFSVPSNADAMWNRVKSRPELAGRGKLLVPVGRVAKLQAGGFASQADAQAACSRLSVAGFACLAVRD